MRLRSLPLACSTLALAAASPAQDHAALGRWGIDLTGMDRSVAPGDDFDRFANGGWKARTTIPADRSSFGLFPDLHAQAEARSRAILDGLPAPAAVPADEAGKVAALYRAFLDERTVEARGDRPLRDLLAPIRTARDRDAVARLMGQANAGLGASFVDLEFGADHVGGHGYQLILAQGGLRLAREYYLEPRYAAQVDAYRAYAARLLGLSGWPDPDGAADRVVALERRIAVASWPAAETRDPVRTLNPVNADRLAAAAPRLPWRAFLAGAGVDDRIRLNLATPSSVARIAGIFAATPLPVLKDWLAFRTADRAASYLPGAYVQARFAFNRTQGGPAALSPRWRRGVSLIDDAIGSALGRLYAARYLAPNAQATVERLVANLRRAFEARIRAAAWMSPATQGEALRKLARLEVQVGSPRQPIDYSELVVRRDDLFGNVLRAHAFDWRRRVAEGHGPWNKSDWRFWPQDPTAYNENGQLIFTAAMLQPPFFNPAADPAVNYGAIGSVIGHEISHNFDDQGRMVDADGRQRDWWTPIDAARFNSQARRLSAQFSAMQPLPGLHVNGDLTLGENIADLAGVSIALEAYHRSLGGAPAGVLDGFTGDQRFFLSWAQGWREKDRSEHLRDLILSDVHSPAATRVNGPLRNMDDWYAAWGIEPGAAHYVASGNRVRLW